MLVWLYRTSAQACRRYLLSTGNPRHIAHGLALGVLLGLLPKANLTAVAVLTLIFALHVHLGAAMLSASVLTLLGPLLHPLADRVGGQMLRTEPMAGWLQSIWSAPFAAWTALDNTVVCGAFAIGLAAYLPTFYLGRRWGARWLHSHASDTPAVAPETLEATDATAAELESLMQRADQDGDALESALSAHRARPVRRLDESVSESPLIVEDIFRVYRAEEAVALTDPSENVESSPNEDDADAESEAKSEAEAATEPAAVEPTTDSDDDGSQEQEDEPAVVALRRPELSDDDIVNGRRGAAGYFRGA